ncbi:hypothetical protein [Pedobacter sp. ASV12]|uniref:hypothetical protein n=1 Tax=Pedobacter sp. ASV12 TaxID=2795120 RepID=UPI0018EAA193|nr:hypothetical protein [Pedobacter sp. ASV12]
MKKENLLSKADLRKVLGGSIGRGVCETKNCSFEFMGIEYAGQCGSSIQEGAPITWCRCIAMGPYGDFIEDDTNQNCYVA